jgi:hypothetical protein
MDIGLADAAHITELHTVFQQRVGKDGAVPAQFRLNRDELNVGGKSRRF